MSSIVEIFDCQTWEDILKVGSILFYLTKLDYFKIHIILPLLQNAVAYFNSTPLSATNKEFLLQQLRFFTSVKEKVAKIVILQLL